MSTIFFFYLKFLLLLLLLLDFGLPLPFSFLRSLISLPWHTLLNIYICSSLAFQFKENEMNLNIKMKNVGEAKEVKTLVCVCVLSDKKPNWLHYKSMYSIKVSQAHKISFDPF